MIAMPFTHQLNVLRRSTKWPKLVVDNGFLFLFRVLISIASILSICIQTYLITSRSAPNGVYCFFAFSSSSDTTDYSSYSERCIYQGSYYLPYSTSGANQSFCEPGSAGSEPYLSDGTFTSRSPVTYYPFVLVYLLLVWLTAYTPLAFYYGVVKNKLAEFPQPMLFETPREVGLTEGGYNHAQKSLQKSSKAFAYSFSRVRSKNGGLYAAYLTYSFSYVVYVVSVIALTDWFLDFRFLTFSYNTLLYDAHLLCNPFPLTLGCQVFVAGPSGTKQKLQGVCEFPFNYMNKRIFLGYFLIFHLLIVGCLLNIVYVGFACCSPQFRWNWLRAKAQIPLNSSRNHVLANVFNQISVGDWLVLSLVGSNVQTTFFEHIIYHIADKIRKDMGNGFHFTTTGNHLGNKVPRTRIKNSAMV